MKVISTKLTDFDYSVSFDLSRGKISVVLDCIFIGNGNTLVQGAKVAIVNETTDFPIKAYEDDYDIAPPMTGVVEVDFPKSGGIFQYGNYSVKVLLNDGAKTFELEKQQNISGPEGQNNINIGGIKTEFRADCNAGKVLVYQNPAPGYKGKSPLAYSFDYTLYYPGRAQLDPVSVKYLPFEIVLQPGENEIEGKTSVTYDLGEKIFVVVPYNGNRKKNVRCQFNLCEAFRGLELTLSRINTCSAVEAEEYRQKMAASLQLIIIIMLGQDAGEDVSDYIEQLEQMTGCSCDCESEVITGVPAASVIIRGCTVEKTQQGLTAIYDIGAKNYSISLSGGNKAFFSITPSAPSECQQNYEFVFNASALVSEIHNIYTNNAELRNQLISIVWAVLAEVDPKCLTTTVTWASLGAKDKMQLLVNKICEALTSSGGGGEGEPGAPDVSLTCVSATFSSSFVSGSPSSGLLSIPCSVVGAGVISGNVTGSGFSGVLQTTSITGSTTLLTFSVTYDGSGIAGNRSLTVSINSASEPVSCVVTATVSAVTNCSAPVGISVTSNVSGNQISFSPASFAPPSYQVQRRLLSDPDVAGSYTTIGTPTYNSSTGKFEITDAIGGPSSPLANTEYYYKAISMCANGSRPFVGIGYTNITCPAMTLSSDMDSVSYEFPHLGGDIDLYQVSLWNAAGTVRLAGPRTMSPPFGATISDTFDGLSASTNYILRVEPVIAPFFSRTCTFNVQTGSVTTYTGVVLLVNNSGEVAVINPNEGFTPAVNVVDGNEQSFTVVTPTNDPGFFRIFMNATGVPYDFDAFDISNLVVVNGVASIVDGKISVVPTVPGTTVVMSGTIILNGLV